MKYLFVSFLLLISFYGCMTSNIHIMPDYESRKINDEDLILIETRLDKTSEYKFLISGDQQTWDSALTMVTRSKIDYFNFINSTEFMSLYDLFSLSEDSMSFIPNYFDIGEDLQINSTFKNVIKYKDDNVPPLIKQKLFINENDPIEIYIPNSSTSFPLIKDQAKYLLFIQFPNKIYLDEHKINLNINFCLWDHNESRIISYGRFSTFNTSNYQMNFEDFTYEIIRRILIETPFYKNKMTRRAQWSNQTPIVDFKNMYPNYKPGPKFK